MDQLPLQMECFAAQMGSQYLRKREGTLCTLVWGGGSRGVVEPFQAYGVVWKKAPFALSKVCCTWSTATSPPVIWLGKYKHDAQQVSKVTVTL